MSKSITSIGRQQKGLILEAKHFHGNLLIKSFLPFLARCNLESNFYPFGLDSADFPGKIRTNSSVIWNANMKDIFLTIENYYIKL